MLSSTISSSFPLFTNNIHHQSLLPIYPFVNNTTEPNLLLANIPEHDLNSEQFEFRYQYGYHQPTSTRPKNDHERRIAYLSRLWNINYSILEFNHIRMMKLANLFGANRIHRFSILSNQAYLHEDEYSIALEFFLQIDINLFYMKTCSYRDAIPLLSNKSSLMCINEPEVYYGMTRCNRISCCLCYPSYKLTYRHDKPIIQFGPNQQHVFINKYRSILNCSATCQTRNIIYVLTCPCHRVDYIGETSLSLASRLSYHQKHSNRIIQEFLLGQKNMSRIQCNEIKLNETITKDSMTLYQHFARCSSAMQWFLDENPDYWPFIPIKYDQTKEAEESTEAATSAIDLTTHSFFYANDVPSPPNNYRFTYQQKVEIERFFYEKKYLSSPNFHLDLYEAAIVAILPFNASDVLRRFIEALFITHTQAQLNTDGHLDYLLFSNMMTNQNQESFQQEIWCKNLIRRSVEEEKFYVTEKKKGL